MKSFFQFLTERANQITKTFVHSDGRKAHVVSMHFSEGGSEHSVHLNGSRMTTHSTFEKAAKRLTLQGFKPE